MNQSKTLYTCLYITNACINDCSYCGYRRSNGGERTTLVLDEIAQEIDVIKSQGIRNVIVIGGTLPEQRYASLILETTKMLVQQGINPWIEFENLSQSTLAALHNVGADHFVLFQETYDPVLYARVHATSPLKKDYHQRKKAIDDAAEVGFSHIGIGALFGLGDEITEVNGLKQHAEALAERGVHVIVSAPTLKHAEGSEFQDYTGDVVALYHLLHKEIPCASLALSARESAEARNQLFPLVEYVGAGGVTIPGGRTINKGGEQFALADSRSPLEIRRFLNLLGFDVQ